MSTIKAEINGSSYTFPEGLTILEAVGKNRIDEIPSLCYEERLGHINSCFLCVVEAEGYGRLLSACSTVLTDGMKIRTNSETVRRARRECLELLMSDHYADCVSPCRFACPANIDIQGYLLLAEKGFFTEAVELIKEKNPLPVVCGRVCVKPCELKCRRELIDRSVAIDNVKRGLSESEPGRKVSAEPAPSTGKKAAVVGSGPSGLSYAYYMAKKGHEVTIFEQMPKTGGMLRYGIPAYRMPEDLLDLEIGKIRELGVRFHTSSPVDSRLFSRLRQEYDTVYLAHGAWKAIRTDIHGESGEKVVGGIDFLRKTRTGEIGRLKGRILVIGGGNTAIDAARTALRLGADEVMILYRRTEAEMPAHREEIEAAGEEGVRFSFLSAPIEVSCTETGATLTCMRMQLGEPDESGRRKPEPVENSQYREESDLIIEAVGQQVDSGFLNGAADLKINRDRISADPGQLAGPGVYAGGDCVSGPATVIEAIAAGRKAAEETDRFLRGGEKPAIPFYTAMNLLGEVSAQDMESLVKSRLSRLEMPQRSPRLRSRDFEETETTYGAEETAQESGRCLTCGCNALSDCLLRKYCEEYGVKADRYRGFHNKFPRDLSHPFIQLEPGKCIRCQRCIKTCEKIQGASALDLKNRGFSSVIATGLDRPMAHMDCDGCGNCIDSCPTGALTEKGGYFPITQQAEISHTVCIYCRALCPIKIESFGRYVRISSARSKTTGQGEYICGYGRFAMKRFFGADRLLKPLLRSEYGDYDEISWTDAMKRTAGAVIKTAQKGGDSLAVLLSSSLSREEIEAARRLAAAAGTVNIALLRPDKLNIYRTDGVRRQIDFDEADLIVVLGDELDYIMPALKWKIRASAAKGAAVAEVGVQASFLKGVENRQIYDMDIGQFIEKKLPELMDSGNNPVIVFKNGCKAEKKLISLTERKGMLIPVDYSVNAFSFACENILNSAQPDYGKIRTAILVGDEPFGYENPCMGADFIAVISTSSCTAEADLILPASVPSETGGSFTDYAGRLVKTKPSMQARTAKSNREILEEITAAVLAGQGAPE